MTASTLGCFFTNRITKMISLIAGVLFLALSPVAASAYVSGEEEEQNVDKVFVCQSFDGITYTPIYVNRDVLAGYQSNPYNIINPANESCPEHTTTTIRTTTTTPPSSTTVPTIPTTTSTTIETTTTHSSTTESTHPSTTTSTTESTTTTVHKTTSTTTKPQPTTSLDPDGNTTTTLESSTTISSTTPPSTVSKDSANGDKGSPDVSGKQSTGALPNSSNDKSNQATNQTEVSIGTEGDTQADSPYRGAYILGSFLILIVLIVLTGRALVSASKITLG